MAVISIFAALTITSCGDDDEPVVNASLEGTWKIISGTTTGQGDFELIPEGFSKNPQTDTADETIYPVSLDFQADGNGIYTYRVTEYSMTTVDGQDIVESEFVEKTSAFTYTTANESPAGAVSNNLPYMTITFAATPYFKEITQTASYRIEGDVLYLYHDFPRASDTLRKQ